MSALTPSETRWYYARERKKVGPLTWDQLRQLVDTGALTPTDMLLQDGAGKWQPANSFPNLFTSCLHEESKNTTGRLWPESLPPDPQTAADHLSLPPMVAVRPGGTARGFPEVPGYVIEDELGRGGMGVVYKARHLRLNRVVALKMVLHAEHAGAEERARFQTEAEAVARLQHPGIVQIHEVGEHSGLAFFSLEFCPGGSLAGKLGGTPLPPREAATLVEGLARAMQTAHDKGVVHRDLKPANVLLAENGTPKVTDFGLAKKLDEEGRTATGAIMGTPSYMAPSRRAGNRKRSAQRWTCTPWERSSTSV